MPSGIQFTYTFQTFLSRGYSLLGELIATQLGRIGLPEFNHDFTLLPFDNQIGKNLLANIQQSISRSDPAEYFSFELPTTGRSGSGRCSSAEDAINPVEQSDVSTIYLKQPPIVLSDVAVASPLRKFAYEEASFSIYNPSEICYISWFIFLRNVILRSLIIWSSLFLHSIPLFTHQYYYPSINEAEPLVQAERLNERTLEKEVRKSDLRSKDAEENPKRFSRLVIGH